MKNNARFIEDDTVLQTDTTFGDHNFYVASVAIQDKSIISNHNHRPHPWVMIAVAFHEKKEQRVLELIVQDVLNATPG